MWLTAVAQHIGRTGISRRSHRNEQNKNTHKRNQTITINCTEESKETKQQNMTTKCQCSIQFIGNDDFASDVIAGNHLSSDLPPQ